MSRAERTRITWCTSSYTADQGNCVEVGAVDGDVLVRDTKDRAGGNLAAPAGSWGGLLRTVRQRAAQPRK